MVKDTIKRHKEQIDKELKDFLEERLERSDAISPVARELMEHIIEFNLRGGKRIRPILVIFGYKACGGVSPDIIKAALAVELMESFLLIHDDIMDQDELRRGYLTLHRVFENKCSRSFCTDSKRYGESMAILAGDILAILGSEAIINSHFPINNKLNAIDKFNRAVVNTCIGQAMDIRISCDPKATVQDIEKMYELKTAVYTLEAPLHIGALLAGATKTQLRCLSKYAIPLGKAFQLQDDILGLYGSRERIGKPVGSDIREGKKTLLIMSAMEMAEKKHADYIRKCLGSKSLTLHQLEKVRLMVRECGALEKTQSMAKIHVEEAKAALRANLNKNAQKFLLALADYIVNRDH